MLQLCPGEGVFRGIAALGEIVHRLAAGVGQAQNPGDLVKALPCGVVPGCPQDGHIRIPRHVHNHGVAPGDAQGQEGGLQLGKGQIVGRDMAPEMVDRDQRLPHSQGGAFGEVHRHQQRADETGTVSHGDGVDLPAGDTRLSQGPVRQGGDGLHMLPGGDFRHHAAIEGVNIHLRQDGVGADDAAILHHGGGGLITGGFKG